MKKCRLQQKKYLQPNVSLKCYGSTAIWFSNQNDVAYFTAKWNAFKTGIDQKTVDTNPNVIGVQKDDNILFIY